MVFLMKVKTDKKSAKFTMPSETHNSFNQITATDLSAILFKDSSKTPSQLDRDAGFCSGGSEIGDDYQSDRTQSSPSSTDASDDSVDIKLSSIKIPPKRKALDAIKCENDIPLKKRFKFESILRSADQIDPMNSEPLTQPDTFRPWIPENLSNNHMPNEAELLARHPFVTTLHNVCEDEQPLALVTTRSNDHKSNAEICLSKTLIKTDKDESEENQPKSLNDDSKSSLRSTPQRNYKNMTRERRIEANARERTRVHCISEAFDTLRQAIPSYSNTQKLSKLSILRVACAYILTLSRMTGLDYSEDQSSPSIQSCLEEITKNIQTEGKARKRKDE